MKHQINSYVDYLSILSELHSLEAKQGLSKFFDKEEGEIIQCMSEHRYAMPTREIVTRINKKQKPHIGWKTVESRLMNLYLMGFIGKRMVKNRKYERLWFLIIEKDQYFPINRESL